MEQIALGLELSKVNFIWVIRFPVGEEIGTEEALPRGFLERPLRMEAIKFGVPIVAVPMHLDQPLNARLVEEMGIGEEVVRNKQGKIEKEELARVIRKVVDKKTSSGDEFRRKVRELSEKMNEKGEEEIDDVVEEMVKLCRKVDRYNSVDMLI
ncbi:hypothetical protein ACH5RR_019005 [Cinchona calisaya]|uniref:Uncharacterized protein n=1 Tax=Cinchona calisaya TaxID=153742 RepID=A0ABD2ZPT2_9GENT